jgi:2-iminoacetate synthase ThiH
MTLFEDLELDALLQRVLEGELLDNQNALKLADADDTVALADVATRLRDRGHGNVVSYSRKVFLPLTHCAVMCATTAPLHKPPDIYHKPI